MKGARLLKGRRVHVGSDSSGGEEGPQAKVNMEGARNEEGPESIAAMPTTLGLEAHKASSAPASRSMSARLAALEEQLAAVSAGSLDAVAAARHTHVQLGAALLRAEVSQGGPLGVADIKRNQAAWQQHNIVQKQQHQAPTQRHSATSILAAAGAGVPAPVPIPSAPATAVMAERMAALETSLRDLTQHQVHHTALLQRLSGRLTPPLAGTLPNTTCDGVLEVSDGAIYAGGAAWQGPAMNAGWDSPHGAAGMPRRSGAPLGSCRSPSPMAARLSPSAAAPVYRPPSCGPYMGPPRYNNCASPEPGCPYMPSPPVRASSATTSLDAMLPDSQICYGSNVASAACPLAGSVATHGQELAAVRGHITRLDAERRIAAATMADVSKRTSDELDEMARRLAAVESAIETGSRQQGDQGEGWGCTKAANHAQHEALADRVAAIEVLLTQGDLQAITAAPAVGAASSRMSSRRTSEEQREKVIELVALLATRLEACEEVQRQQFAARGAVDNPLFAPSPVEGAQPQVQPSCGSSSSAAVLPDSAVAAAAELAAVLELQQQSKLEALRAEMQAELQVLRTKQVAMQQPAAIVMAEERTAEAFADRMQKLEDTVLMLSNKNDALAAELESAKQAVACHSAQQVGQHTSPFPAAGGRADSLELLAVEVGQLEGVVQGSLILGLQQSVEELTDKLARLSARMDVTSEQQQQQQQQDPTVEAPVEPICIASCNSNELPSMLQALKGHVQGFEATMLREALPSLQADLARLAARIAELEVTVGQPHACSQGAWAAEVVEGHTAEVAKLHAVVSSCQHELVCVAKPEEGGQDQATGAAMWDSVLDTGPTGPTDRCGKGLTSAALDSRLSMAQQHMEDTAQAGAVEMAGMAARAVVARVVTGVRLRAVEDALELCARSNTLDAALAAQAQELAAHRAALQEVDQRVHRCASIEQIRPVLEWMQQLNAETNKASEDLLSLQASQAVLQVELDACSARTTTLEERVATVACALAATSAAQEAASAATCNAAAERAAAVVAEAIAALEHKRAELVASVEELQEVVAADCVKNDQLARIFAARDDMVQCATKMTSVFEASSRRSLHSRTTSVSHTTSGAEPASKKAEAAPLDGPTGINAAGAALPSTTLEPVLEVATVPSEPVTAAAVLAAGVHAPCTPPAGSAEAPGQWTAQAPSLAELAIKVARLEASLPAQEQLQHGTHDCNMASAAASVEQTQQLQLVQAAIDKLSARLVELEAQSSALGDCATSLTLTPSTPPAGALGGAKTSRTTSFSAWALRGVGAEPGTDQVAQQAMAWEVAQQELLRKLAALEARLVAVAPAANSEDEEARMQLRRQQEEVTTIAAALTEHAARLDVLEATAPRRASRASDTMSATAVEAKLVVLTGRAAALESQVQAYPPEQLHEAIEGLARRVSCIEAMEERVEEKHSRLAMPVERHPQRVDELEQGLQVTHQAQTSQPLCSQQQREDIDEDLNASCGSLAACAGEQRPAARPRDSTVAGGDSSIHAADEQAVLAQEQMDVLRGAVLELAEKMRGLYEEVAALQQARAASAVDTTSPRLEVEARSARLSCLLEKVAALERVCYCSMGGDGSSTEDRPAVGVHAPLSLVVQLQGELASLREGSVSREQFAAVVCMVREQQQQLLLQQEEQQRGKALCTSNSEAATDLARLHEQFGELEAALSGLQAVVDELNSRSATSLTRGQEVAFGNWVDGLANLKGLLDKQAAQQQNLTDRLALLEEGGFGSGLVAAADEPTNGQRHVPSDQTGSSVGGADKGAAAIAPVAALAALAGGVDAMDARGPEVIGDGVWLVANSIRISRHSSHGSTAGGTGASAFWSARSASGAGMPDAAVMASTAGAVILGETVDEEGEDSTGSSRVGSATAVGLERRMLWELARRVAALEAGMAAYGGAGAGAEDGTEEPTEEAAAVSTQCAVLAGAVAQLEGVVCALQAEQGEQAARLHAATAAAASAVADAERALAATSEARQVAAQQATELSALVARVEAADSAQNETPMAQGLSAHKNPGELAPTQLQAVATANEGNPEAAAGLPSKRASEALSFDDLAAAPAPGQRAVAGLLLDAVTEERSTGSAGGVGALGVHLALLSHEHQVEYLHRLTGVVAKHADRLRAQYSDDEVLTSQLDQVDASLRGVQAHLSNGPLAAGTSKQQSQGEALLAILDQVAALRAIGSQTHPALQAMVEAHEVQIAALSAALRSSCGSSTTTLVPGKAAEDDAWQQVPVEAGELLQRVQRLEALVEGASVGSTQAAQHEAAGLASPEIAAGKATSSEGADVVSRIADVEARMRGTHALLSALRAQVAPIREYLDSTQGMVRELQVAHGMVLQRLDAAEIGNMGGSTSLASGSSGVLRHMQEDVATLSTRLAAFEANGAQVAEAVRDVRRLAARVADGDSRSAATASRLAGVAGTLPVLVHQLSELEARISSKLGTASRALEALAGQLQSLGMMHKPTPSKNPLAALGPHNEAIKMLEAKMEAVRTALSASVRLLLQELSQDAAVTAARAATPSLQAHELTDAAAAANGEAGRAQSAAAFSHEEALKVVQNCVEEAKTAAATALRAVTPTSGAAPVLASEF